MILTYLECALQDEEFEYFWGSVRPSVQNLKLSHAVKTPKAVGLDRHEGPEIQKKIDPSKIDQELNFETCGH